MNKWSEEHRPPAALLNLHIRSYAFKNIEEWNRYISCYVTNTKMKHQSQQEVIIITWTWLLGTSYPGTIALHNEKHKPLQSTHI